MQSKFIVTTRSSVLQEQDLPIVMVDGTVPGWVKRDGDLHYDHHRPGGADVQIAEMEEAPVLMEDCLFVTTQVDADACVAAAWLQLTPEERDANRDRLEAIAYDCDHLAVPVRLSHLGDFASCAVAAMKLTSTEIVSDLGFPIDRREWSIEQKDAYASEAFRRGTQWLIDACRGDHWPGESGEAVQYWQSVEENIEMIIDQGRVSLYRDCLLFDAKGVNRYIDPRCWLRASNRLGINPLLPITLTQREVYTDNCFRGYSYTIGCVPLHPELDKLDFTKGVFASLTEAEKMRNPNADGWGGRRTVGGSGWNTPSNLLPQEVIDIVLRELYIQKLF